MLSPDQGHVGFSIPSAAFLEQLTNDDRRNHFVAEQVRTRLALLIRTLREQREWSQARLGEELGKPQSVVSRLEDPDYGKLSLQTLFETAAAFKLPLYIDMPSWEEWFRLMADLSSEALNREGFDAAILGTIRDQPSDASAAYAKIDEDIQARYPAGFNLISNAPNTELNVLAVSAGPTGTIVYQGVLNVVDPSYAQVAFGGPQMITQATAAEPWWPRSKSPSDYTQVAARSPRRIALQEQVSR